MILPRIFAYALFVLGSLIMIFFNHYSGKYISSPFIFYVIGVVLWAVGIYLLRYARSANDRTARRQLSRRMAYLYANGEKIPVDLTTCEIRGNDWDETVEITRYGRPNDYVSVDIEESVFIYMHKDSRTGTLEKFVSPVIPKDKISLAFHLEAQRQTTLYVDKTDRSSYFFDLDFLG